MKEKAPNYFIKLISKCETNKTKNNSILTFSCWTDCFKYSFSHRKSESISIFKSKLLSFIRPVQTSIYNIFDPKGLTFLTGLRLGLSHLNEDRFRHDFQDCVNPICSCSLEIEDTSHYFLHCHHFSHHCIIFMNSVKSIILSLYMVTHDFMKTRNYFEIQYKLYKKKMERFSGSLFV